MLKLADMLKMAQDALTELKRIRELLEQLITGGRR